MTLSRLSALLLSFFPGPATTRTYTLSLHDALPISIAKSFRSTSQAVRRNVTPARAPRPLPPAAEASCRGRERRSEEHTSELQSRLHLVCRLLLEKKKKK